MKSKMRTLLVILLVLTLTLCACAEDTSPAGVVKKQLTSGVWYADMSEGTTAGYTFTAKGEFTCEATVSAGEESASFTRQGTYAVMEENGGVSVVLQYPDVNYQVEITCTLDGDSCAFQIAGCDMYQK